MLVQSKNSHYGAFIIYISVKGPPQSDINFSLQKHTSCSVVALCNCPWLSAYVTSGGAETQEKFSILPLLFSQSQTDADVVYWSKFPPLQQNSTLL